MRQKGSLRKVSITIFATRLMANFLSQMLTSRIATSTDYVLLNGGRLAYIHVDWQMPNKGLI
jgi:hypothetical protein